MKLYCFRKLSVASRKNRGVPGAAFPWPREITSDGWRMGARPDSDAFSTPNGYKMKQSRDGTALLKYAKRGQPGKVQVIPKDFSIRCKAKILKFILLHYYVV